MPRRPDRGSWTISMSASCSLTPSSARAASRAASTVGALLSTSCIARPLVGGALRRARRRSLPRLGRRTPLQPAHARGAVAAGALGLRWGLLRRLRRGQLALVRTPDEMLEPDLDEVRGRPI